MNNDWVTFLSDAISYPVLTDDDHNQLLLFDLSEWSIISVLGNNAATFLQGHATCDIRKVTDQQGQLGGFCDNKGRLYALFFAFYWQNNYHLLMPKAIIAHTINQLHKYAMLSRVSLQDQSDNLNTLGFSTLSSNESLISLFNYLPEQIYGTFVENESIIMRIPGFQPRFMLTGELNKLKHDLEKLRTSVQCANNNYWDLLNIRAKLPFIYNPTIGQFTPHQLNLPDNNGVSFDKGCYTGQEIVARMHYRGKLKQHLHRASLTDYSLPQAMENLYSIKDNQENKTAVGQVVMAAQSDVNQYEILAIINNNALAQQPIYLREINGPPIEIL
jgi:folate-binding protein YgfZ